MSEDNPEFEADDAQDHLELYRNMDPKDAFDHFEEQRETNIEYLRDLPLGSCGPARERLEAPGEIWTTARPPE